MDRHEILVDNKIAIKTMERVKKILSILNLVPDSAGEQKLDFIHELELERLLNYLNRDDLPKELVNTLAYRILGHFLKDSFLLEKYVSLKDLKAEDFMTIIEIKEYETNAKFSRNDILTNEKEKLLKFLDVMKDYGLENELARHRKLIWT